MNYARRLARRAASRKGRAAVKDQNRRGFFAERLEDRSLMAADVLSNFHNYSTPTDVNADGTVAASDVLMIINSINSLGARQLPQSAGEGESGAGYLDVDNDGYVTANDVLKVINFLNAEGEAGSALPQKASYTLQIFDSNGVALTTTANRTATIEKIRILCPTGWPGHSAPRDGLGSRYFPPYTDILFDNNFATIAANETQAVCDH